MNGVTPPRLCRVVLTGLVLRLPGAAALLGAIALSGAAALLGAAMVPGTASGAGPQIQPKPRAISAAAVPAPPVYQLANPALDAFGFDRYAAPSVEHLPTDTTFVRGRMGIRATHWSAPLAWKTPAPLEPLAPLAPLADTTRFSSPARDPGNQPSTETHEVTSSIDPWPTVPRGDAREVAIARSPDVPSDRARLLRDPWLPEDSTADTSARRIDELDHDAPAAPSGTPADAPFESEPQRTAQRQNELAGWYDAYLVAAWTRFSPDVPTARALLPLDALPSLAVPRSPCRTRPTQLSRYGGETDTLKLINCDGSVAPEAIDRLTLLLRPTEIHQATFPLPDVADEKAIPAGEWVEGVKLIHPRLIWLIQQIADAFPWRQIYVMSGYRRGSHEGLHGQARAVDLFVLGAANERVYKVCRELVDAGCGYYPNNLFVHVDARKPGTGHAYWIDTSGPGEPSEYVDSWPGVEEGGARAWVSER